MLSGEVLQGFPAPKVMLIYAVIAACVWYIGLLAYRLLFHPLSRYPGPLGAKISNYQNWAHASNGSRHLAAYKLHQQYGPVVRFGPDKISFNSATALRDIYGSRKANVVKADFYHVVQAAEGSVSTFSAIDNDSHAKKRRMLANAFSEQSIRSMESQVLTHIDKWLTNLGKGPQQNGWTEAHNISKFNSWLVFDILTDLCYGRNFDLQNTEETRFMRGVIPTGVSAVYIVAYHPWTKVLRKILLGNPVGDFLGGKMTRDLNTFLSTSRRILAERMQREELAIESKQPIERKDFFHYLFKERDAETGQSWNVSELQAESHLLMVAGSDTTSTTLSAFFFYALRNPVAYEKLTKEIRSSFSSIDEILYTGTVLPKLPYLRAFIDETLRQNPPVAAQIPRYVLPGGAMIDNVYVPAGTTIGVSPYAIHHNPDYFPQPFTFRPGRWIVDEKSGGTTAEDVARAQSAFFPFNIGSRGCVGKNLAYQELSIAIARVVWLYDMREGDRGVLKKAGKNYKGMEGEESEYPIEDYFVAHCDGPMVSFKRRAEK